MSSATIAPEPRAIALSKAYRARVLSEGRPRARDASGMVVARVRGPCLTSRGSGGQPTGLACCCWPQTLKP